VRDKMKSEKDNGMSEKGRETKEIKIWGKGRFIKKRLQQ
jgi:hypothetical protein